MGLQIDLVITQHDVLGSLLLMWKTASQATVEPFSTMSNLENTRVVLYIIWNEIVET